MDRRLLLVDDEEGIRKVLGIALADLGYEILAAVDGKHGLQLFRDQRPPIVITDIKMPVMDGIELLQKIKQDDPDTEVIMLTGHGDMELAIQCLKLEATDFVTKPINDDALEIALKRANERIRMRILSLARLSAISKASSLIGLVTKSVASSLRHWMASSISPCPVSMITSVSGSSCLIFCSSSMPSMTGILISVITMGGRWSLKSCNPCLPSTAARIS